MAVGESLQLRVTAVDAATGRISLSGRTPEQAPGPQTQAQSFKLDVDSLAKDCDIEFVRGGGAGGQHRNKVGADNRLGWCQCLGGLGCAGGDRREAEAQAQRSECMWL